MGKGIENQKMIIEDQINELRSRMKTTQFGDVGLVFTMREGKVALIKPINLPVIKPEVEHGKS